MALYIQKVFRYLRILMLPVAANSFRLGRLACFTNLVTKHSNNLDTYVLYPLGYDRYVYTPRILTILLTVQIITLASAYE